MTQIFPEKYTYTSILRFVLPSIAMMITASVYWLADGFFVSRFVGKTEFAALSLVYPIMAIVGALGVMFGTGGAAVVGKTLGEESRNVGAGRANSFFSSIMYTVLILGFALGILGLMFLPGILKCLGADNSLLHAGNVYGNVVLLALPFFIGEYAFQSFFVTAGKPQLGFYATVLGGVLNLALDAFFILVLNWGLLGAAVATAISQAVCVGLELLYFVLPNDSLLRFRLVPDFEWKVLFKAWLNGSSEMVEEIAGSVVAIFYNYQLLRYIGENGVAAYGIIEYSAFIFAAVFCGYTVGISPLISYQYGAENHKALRELYRKSKNMMLISGAFMAGSVWLFSPVLAEIFVGYDIKLYNLVVHAFSIYAASFLFIGLSIFTSAFFTALCNGSLSAVLAFARAFVFEIGCILILPLICGMNGIWYAAVVAEIAAFLMSIAALSMFRKKYQYA